MGNGQSITHFYDLGQLLANDLQIAELLLSSPQLIGPFDRIAT
jgi:hypothetical protein